MRPPLEMLLIIVALAAHTRGLPYGELPPQLQTQDKLVWYGDDRLSQTQNNVYPTYKENIVPEQIGQAQFDWDQSQQNTFEGYETRAPSESQKQLNPDYAYQPDQTLQPYPSAVDDFTISCNGKNKICVAKSLCIDGYVHPLKQGFIRPGQVQECKLSHEVCCTVRYDLDNLPYDNDQINTVLKDNQYPEPTLENDEKYVPYGENNQADVTELKPPLGNDAELQSPSDNGYEIEPANQPRDDTKPAEELPIDYNQIPAGTNQREQYQTGDTSASEPVFSPLKPASANSNPAVFQFTVHMGCAAALLCVEEQYCTLEGMISPEPVVLTSKQLLRRVPLSSCRISKTGAAGKCCRDPNYVDPWPTGNLPANYTGGFDEQGFPTFLNIAKVRPPKKPVTQPPIKTIPKPPVKLPVHEQLQPTNVVPLVPDDSDVIPQRVLPISTQVPIAPPVSTPVPFIENPYDPISSDQDSLPIVPGLQLPNNPCGVRNYEQRPTGFRDTDAAFGEIPWQAMVLWSEERKILCSGALISSDIVLTAASCVNRLPPGELSVKLGEWKLGYELEQEEPLPFQIINVQTIKYHPGYVEGSPSNDTAMLLLEHPATFNLHINTLCLPDNYQMQETSRCIVTGWGKSILQAHYAGAIMHMVDVDLLSRDVCQNRVLDADSHINIAHNIICGKAHEGNNMCQADVGSPMACYDGNGAYHIAGIYSQDTGCLPTNQVATFTPIDITWLKQTMHPSEPDIDPSDDGYDYRKSNLPAGNEYLPPV
ncbi:inactive serine protease scarface [Temnothorax americanus]|uniref:inactive serine protease scarface n=1 Tax=Temnothorax americanus TaxID=1964332 RepID=UPI0040681C32